jgi:phage-related minor tail protein
MSLEENPPLNDESAEFTQAIEEVETAIASLRGRYRQINEAEQQKKDLEAQFSQIEPQWRENPLPELEKELEQIREQIQELEVILESNLLKEGELKRLFWEGIRRGLLGEVFWQIVRFGGIGILLGWILRSCTG